MGDAAVARGGAETSRLDTLSYYDDSEPNWNELPYLAKVEDKRGCVGFHIDTSEQTPVHLQENSAQFVSTPASIQQPGSATDKLAKHMAVRGHRVLLSGIGGDEVTGGVPTPLPELEDLLVKGNLFRLSSRLKAWALAQRRPWLHLLGEALRGFLPTALVPVPVHERPLPWLHTAFVQQNAHALRGYPTRLKLTGCVPSVQENLSALDGLRRQLACIPLGTVPLCERRYPYLDRSFLEFIFAVPRTQIVRPGQRRSLMRRALVRIVPDEILNRRRKAFAVRSPWAAIAQDWTILGGQLTSASLGLVDQDKVAAAIDKARQGEEIPLVPMMRLMKLEFWLRSLGSLLDIPAKDFRSSIVGLALSDGAASVTSSRIVSGA
jgi:asparagine synthase (glutamine-hydrolysing)